MKWIQVTIVFVIVALVASLIPMISEGRALDAVAVPDGGASAGPPSSDPRRGELTAARRTCDPATLDAFVAAQRERLEEQAESPTAHRLLAEALLERVLLRGMHKGMVVGQPVFDRLPAASEEDIAEGLVLLERARELGDESSENYRLEAALLGNRITGWASALSLNGRVQAALGKALELDPRNAAVHVALGCRKLLAPALLGHDPEQALEHLRYAADAMPDDERPRIFAAMASWLAGRERDARDWARQAVEINPNNSFARALTRRLETGEEDPFGRDVPVDGERR